MILTVRIMIIQIGDHYSFIGDDDDADDEQDDDVFEIRRTIGEQRFDFLSNPCKITAVQT